jgi:hypothetical protein
MEFIDLPKGKSVDSTSLPKFEAAVATHVVTYTTTQAATANFNAATRFVRIHVFDDSYFELGNMVTAVAGTSPSISGGTVEYFAVEGGSRAAFVATA